MTTLAQLGKSAATALGIPNRSDVGDLTKLKPGLVDFVIQHHRADKAGPHYDVRFGTPETGLYSWATKHELPEPGARRALFQQPIHTHEYAGFQGEIPSGYGKGTVATERRGNILVTASSPDKIEFTTNDKEQPERFVLLKPKAWKDKGWLLINRTAVRPDLTKLGQQSYKCLYNHTLATLFKIGLSAKQAADDGILYPPNLNPVTKPIYKELTMPKEEAELAPFGKPLYKFSPSPTGTIHGSVKSLANDLYSNYQTVNDVVTRLMGLPLQANALTGEVPNPANQNLMTSAMTDLTKKYPGVPPEHLAGLIAQQTDTIASRTARQSKLIDSRQAARDAVDKAVTVPPQYPYEDVSSAGRSYQDYSDPSAAMAAAKRKQQVWQQTPLDWKRRPAPTPLRYIASRLLPDSPVFPLSPGSNNQGYFKPYLKQ